jgi:hypothetical protein
MAARLLEKKMGIFSFLAPKRPLSSGQVSLAPATGSGAVNDRIQRPQVPGSSANAANPQTNLARDDKEWLKYLSSAIRTYRKPGLTLEDEHEIWLKDRSRG